MLLAAATAGLLLATEETQPTSGFVNIVLILMFGVVAWFLIAGPQRRRMKTMRRELAELRDSLGLGDDIVTVGGIHGRVTAVEDEEVTIDVGKGVEIRIARRAVAERIEDDSE